MKGEYTLGAVAMANAGKNTNGSQFFVCIDDCTRKLDKAYNLFGYVTDGMDVALGHPGRRHDASGGRSRSTSSHCRMGDVGLFGPDSVAWRLHADPVMLVGGHAGVARAGARAAAMAAVDQHSKFREDPWGRLERTTHFVMATTYGDTAAAEAAAARVRAVHMPASTASIP